jgi:hypothetical protein
MPKMIKILPRTAQCDERTLWAAFLAVSVSVLAAAALERLLT